MTEFKGTKRTLLLSFISLLMCVSMFVGSTFAWFTDSVVSGNNVIASGNLDVVLEYKTDYADAWKTVDSTTKIFAENALYEPGYTETVFLRVSNAGSLALKYSLMVNIAGEKASTNVNDEEFKLSDYLQIGSYTQDEYSSGFNYADILIPTMFGTREAALSNAENFANIADAESVITSSSPVLPGNDTAQILVLVLNMPETVGNEANHKTGVAAPEINLGISLVATQLNHENDSFGSDYDKDAVLTATTAEEFLEVGSKGGKFYLTEDIAVDADAELIVEAESAIEFDGTGSTITVDGDGASTGWYGYVGFVPPAGEDATVSNVTVTGSGFVEVGHYGQGGGNYTVNNLVIKDLDGTLRIADGSRNLTAAFAHYGTATLNDCTMTGTTCSDSAYTAYDIGFVHDTNTTINGGEYGSMYLWSRADVVLNNVKVDKIDSGAITYKNYGMLTIGAGTHVGTLTITCSDKYTPALTIEEGAVVDAIVYKGVTYTQADWLAR